MTTPVPAGAVIPNLLSLLNIELAIAIEKAQEFPFFVSMLSSGLTESGTGSAWRVFELSVAVLVLSMVRFLLASMSRSSCWTILGLAGVPLLRAARFLPWRLTKGIDRMDRPRCDLRTCWSCIDGVIVDQVRPPFFSASFGGTSASRRGHVGLGEWFWDRKRARRRCIRRPVPGLAASAAAYRSVFSREVHDATCSTSGGKGMVSHP